MGPREPSELPPARHWSPLRDSALMVVMAHNTDSPDTWEREGESKEYFDRFSPNGYAVGVNIM
jgi:hypothetical protein